MLNSKITAAPGAAPCELTTSGVTSIAVANWRGDYTFTTSGTGCEIDTINLGTEHFYEVNFVEGSAYANANINAGAFTDQKSVLHQVGFVLSMIDCNLSDNWKNFLLARLIFAVRTKSGQVFIFGIDNGLSATNFDYATGTAETDANGITALYEGSQLSSPVLVKDWSIIKSLFPSDVPTSISFDRLSYTIRVHNEVGTIENTTYTIEDNMENDVTSQTRIELDTPLEGLTVTNGAITIAPNERTQTGVYTITMTATYGVLTATATLSVDIYD